MHKGGLASSGKLPGAVKPYCFVPPDANAKGGMLHDDGQRLSTVHPDRRDSRGHVYDLMGDLSGDPQQ